MSINWEKILKISQPIFYIANDVAKGIGIENLLPNYYIVCLDDHPLVDYLLHAGIKVFCLERELKQRNKIFRSTSKIIDHPLVLDHINKESKGEIPNILFFKPSAKIDYVCKKYGFTKIGNSAVINHLFEDKVSFYEICLKEGLPVSPGELSVFGNLEFESLSKKYGLPFVIQFGRGWAGNTTFFIGSSDQFSQLKSHFFQKRVKVTGYITGKTILNNACILNQVVMWSLPALQIGAVQGFTSLPAATCGRQWPADLSKNQVNQVNQITEEVGKIMEKSGYKGFFGLDFIVEEKTGRIFLSENNARLTASVPFFTKLEIQADKVPLILYHLSAFMDGLDLKKLSYNPGSIVGSEVIARNEMNCPVKIEGNFMPGIYSHKNEKLSLLLPEYFAKDLERDEFWLTCASKGRIVNPEQELVRVNFPKKVLDKKGKLEKSVVNLVLGIKESLKLENVKT